MSVLSIESHKLWADRTDGGHRDATEEAFASYASELLEVLPTGGVLLDVGCGNCQVTSYLAPHYTKVCGVDFSESMLLAGRLRLDGLGIQNVELIHGELKDYPGPERVDAVLLYAVIQYLTVEDFKKNLEAAKRFLKDDGVICVGLVPDVARKDVYYYGFFLQSRFRKLKRLRSWMALTGYRLQGWLKRDPVWDGVGAWFSHADIRRAAAAVGFDAEFQDARFSDYRFHAFLRLRESSGA